MGDITRRNVVKVTGAAALASATAPHLVVPDRVHAQNRSSNRAQHRLLDLLNIENPIIQAPMAGYVSADLVLAVSAAGGLGSFPCALLTPAQVREEVLKIQAKTTRSINLNFFCHETAQRDESLESAWRQRLLPYYTEFGIDSPALPTRTLPPFGPDTCDIVLELKPRVVSFHFGLPEKTLIDRLKTAGCTIISSATTVTEARWLEDHGADAVIAQGIEAGGHRGMFLSGELSSQLGTLALVPQVADAIRVPVIAAGGIADGRAIAAALALGASAIQIGTAYLLCPEARISALHRAAIKSGGETAITNVLTGRPARVLVTRIIRELGPYAAGVPAFPLPAAALASLRAKAESQGLADFSALYAGQAAPLARELPAAELTLTFAAAARAHASP